MDACCSEDVEPFRSSYLCDTGADVGTIEKAIDWATSQSYVAKEGPLKEEDLIAVLNKGHPVPYAVLWVDPDTGMYRGGHIMILGGCNGQGKYFLHDSLSNLTRTDTWQELTHAELLDYNPWAMVGCLAPKILRNTPEGGRDIRTERRSRGRASPRFVAPGSERYNWPAVEKIDGVPVQQASNEALRKWGREKGVLGRWFYSFVLSKDLYQLNMHRGTILEEEDEEEEDPGILGFYGGVVWLGIITVFIAALSQWIVDTIEGAAASLGMHILFISGILQRKTRPA
eukprot:g17730.t1